MGRVRLFLIGTFLYGLLGTASSRTLQVGLFPASNTLRQTIANSIDGDTIIIDGIVREKNIILPNKNLVIASNFINVQDTSLQNLFLNRTFIDGESSTSDSSSIFISGEPLTKGIKIIGMNLINGTGTKIWDSSRRGGVLCLYPSSSYTFTDTSFVTFENVNFINNKSDNGGAICSDGYPSRLIFKNCSFNNNHATNFGGAICGYANSSLLCNKVIFDSNSAFYGAGVYIYGSSNYYDCGFKNNIISNTQNGIDIYSRSDVQLKRCIIYKNNLSLDGILASGTISASNCILQQSLVAGTSGYFNSCIISDMYYSSSCIYKYNLLYHKMWKYLPESLFLNNLVGISPEFVDSAAGDFRLRSNSVAIDAGDPDSSFLNEPNCGGHNDRIDIGMFGNTPNATCKTQGRMNFVPSSLHFSINYGEIHYDTIHIINNGTGTYKVGKLSDIVIGDSLIKCTGMSSVPGTLIPVGSECRVYLKSRINSYRSFINPIPIQIKFEALNYLDTIKATVGLTNYSQNDLLKLVGALIDFKGVPPNATVRNVRYLHNYGSNTLTIDSIRTSNSVFHIDSLSSYVIRSGDSVRMVISFTPSAIANYNNPPVTVNIYSTNFASGVDQNLILQGQGKNVVFSATPNPMIFNSVLKGDSVTGHLTLNNGNDGPMRIDSLRFVDINNQFSATQVAPFTIPQGASDLAIKFKPISAGSGNFNLKIYYPYSDPSGYSVILQTQCVQPVVTIDKTIISFGNVEVSSSSTDSLSVSNTGTGTLVIDSITSNDPMFLVREKGAQTVNAPFKLHITYSPTAVGSNTNKTITIFGNVGKKTFAVSGNGVPSIVVASSNSLDFGIVGLGQSKTLNFSLTNTSSSDLPISTVTFSSPVFHLATSPQSMIAAGGIAQMNVIFNAPAKGALETNGLMTIMLNSKRIDIQLLARSFGKPYCSITQINPDSIFWDTTFARGITFSATAADSDTIGAQPIPKYLWSSSLKGVIDTNKASFKIRASDLQIGRHVISLRVLDNEGDTSASATANLLIVNRLPYAKILSVNPSGLIIKGSGTITFAGEGFDLDQFATSAKDSLRSFEWYSTVQGLLGTGKTLSIASSILQLGSHRFYIKVVDNEGTASYSDTVAIPVQAGIGRAMIVAGTAFDDNAYFTKNISPNCNWAYQKLLDRGFSHQQIYYMNPIGWQSLSDPYANSNIVDTTSITLDAMRKYLLSPEVKNDVLNSVPLIINLLGHGSSALNNGRFYLNKTEYLTPDTLAAWLDSYGDLPSTAQIIVILDFCYSGSYQTKLRTVYTQNRAIISSSDASNTAYFSSGKCFAWNIWNDVYLGKDLGSAFTDALDWSNVNAPGVNKANPQLNCDKNGTYNTAEDYAIAKTIYIGGSQQLQALHSQIDTSWAKDSTQGIIITARLKGVFSAVWCRLFAPGSGQTAGEVATISLTKVNDSTWGGMYTGKRVAGRYFFISEGSDGDGKYVMAVSGEFSNNTFAITPFSNNSRVPAALFLGSVYPNPMVGPVTFSYGLPADMHIKIAIYDIMGNRLATLVNGYQQAGYYHKMWNIRNAGGQRLGAGHYICKLTAQGKTLLKNLMVAQ